MAPLGRPAERHDGRVLDQQEDVLRDLAADPRTSHGTLVLERLLVGDESESLDQQVDGWTGGRADAWNAVALS